MSEPLADPVAVVRVARKLSPELVDPAEAALLAITVLDKIRANGNGK
jgi:hypothetical protein